MNRRAFITLLGGAAAAWPLAARAQQPGRMRRISVLMNSDENDAEVKAELAAFTQGLRNLGWTDGQNVSLDIRWSRGNAEGARSAASELLSLSPDAILSATTPNLTALLRQAPIVPVVFVAVNDPVAQGFVSNLAHPGGNITGFAAYEFSVGGKWIDLLKQVVPGLTHVAIIFNPDTSSANFLFDSIKTLAPSLGVEVTAATVHDAAGIERAIENVSQQPNGGLVLAPDPLLQVHRRLTVELAARYRVPAISWERYFTEIGGLMSYGVDNKSIFRQAAIYIDRVLKGAKPSELPVQTPTRFDLVINVKTAKALGIEVPTNLLLIADDYIQ
jgi:putative ABC transport system substrate-binding protein